MPGGLALGMMPTHDLGCVPNWLMRGMLVELGIDAFNALTHEWFNPELALEQKLRWANGRGAAVLQADGQREADVLPEQAEVSRPAAPLQLELAVA